MTVIKNLAFFNKNKLKKLDSFIESNLSLSDFHSPVIGILHNFLPFNLKFLEESYIALEDKKIKGILTVNKIGKKKLKITRLLLDENSLQSGKLLVNFAVTLFLSKGAESFYVTIDKNNTTLLTMFLEGCNFKKRASEIIYRIKSEDIIRDSSGVNFEHIKKINYSDIEKAQAFLNDLIKSFQKSSFQKDKNELRKISDQYFLFNRNQDKILGYFSIIKINKSDYFLEFTISKGFEGYYSDIIQFTKAKLIKNKDFKTLYIKLKSFYINYEELNQILMMEYKDFVENEILIKDFLIEKKQENFYGKMIFNDATPAF